MTDSIYTEFLHFSQLRRWPRLVDLRELTPERKELKFRELRESESDYCLLLKKDSIRLSQVLLGKTKGAFAEYSLERSGSRDGHWTFGSIDLSGGDFLIKTDTETGNQVCAGGFGTSSRTISYMSDDGMPWVEPSAGSDQQTRVFLKNLIRESSSCGFEGRQISSLFTVLGPLVLEVFRVRGAKILDQSDELVFSGVFLTYLGKPVRENLENRVAQFAGSQNGMMSRFSSLTGFKNGLGKAFDRNCRQILSASMFAESSIESVSFEKENWIMRFATSIAFYEDNKEQLTTVVSQVRAGVLRIELDEKSFEKLIKKWSSNIHARQPIVIDQAIVTQLFAADTIGQNGLGGSSSSYQIIGGMVSAGIPRLPQAPHDHIEILLRSLSLESELKRCYGEKSGEMITRSYCSFVTDSNLFQFLACLLADVPNAAAYGVDLNGALERFGFFGHFMARRYSARVVQCLEDDSSRFDFNEFLFRMTERGLLDRICSQGLDWMPDSLAAKQKDLLKNTISKLSEHSRLFSEHKTPQALVRLICVGRVDALLLAVVFTRIEAIRARKEISKLSKFYVPQVEFNEFETLAFTCDEIERLNQILRENPEAYRKKGALPFVRMWLEETFSFAQKVWS